MGSLVLKTEVKQEELTIIKEEYGEYVKVVVDIVNEMLAAGGEWHADAEKLLIDAGSKQSNIWGGGIDLTTGQVDYISLINTRPNLNNSQEVTDPSIRKKMDLIIKEVFKNYVRN